MRSSAFVRRPSRVNDLAGQTYPGFHLAGQLEGGIWFVHIPIPTAA